MAVPRRSGSEARRQLVMSGVLVALLAALLLVGADSQRVAIAQWIAADPTSSLARMRGVLIGLALVGVSPLLVYAAAVGMNLARGRRDIDCGCAGFGRRQSLHEWLLARNLLYVVIAGGAALVPVARPLTWFDALTALLAVSALAALAMAFDGLAALAPSFRRLDERA